MESCLYPGTTRRDRGGSSPDAMGTMASYSYGLGRCRIRFKVGFEAKQVAWKQKRPIRS
jgi:hypothetical protein